MSKTSHDPPATKRKRVLPGRVVEEQVVAVREAQGLRAALDQLAVELVRAGLEQALALLEPAGEIVCVSDMQHSER